MGKENRLKKRHLMRALQRLDRGAGSTALESRQVKPKPSPWEEALADDKLYRDHATDRISFNSVARGLRKVAERDKEWCGIPMPLNGEKLVIEEKNPWATGLAAVELARVSPRPNHDPRPAREFRCVISDTDQPVVRNTFWSSRLSSEIVIWEQDGKFTCSPIPGIHHFGMDLHTLGCADAWSLETEMTAMHSLRELIGHHHFRQYLLTGMFLESSKRSGVKYAFRRLKPTVAIGSTKSGELKILCCLCLHPIAFYDGTWAGAMCPTDDVIGHLMLMRGDEAMFWRRANQHPPHRPEAGL